MSSREQFEKWYLSKWGFSEDNLDSLFEESQEGVGYYRFGVRLAFDAWQASRAAIEVQLPYCDAHQSTWQYQDAAEERIRSIGLKIKGE